MKQITTFESFLNEATNSRYDIYKKPIDWKEHPTSNGSYIAKVKKSTLEIISKGYGSWMLKVDGKLVMPTETAKEKTAEDNHTSSFNWSDDMVGALKHTAQELFESAVDESLNESAGFSDYEKALTSHDWYYQMGSDRAYDRGTDEIRNIKKIYADLDDSDKKKAFGIWADLYKKKYPDSDYAKGIKQNDFKGY